MLHTLTSVAGDVPSAAQYTFDFVTERDSFIRDIVIPGGVALAGIAVRFLERLGTHVFRVEQAGEAGITPSGDHPFRFRPRNSADFFASVDLFIAAVTVQLLYIWGSPELMKRVRLQAGSAATNSDFAVPYLLATLGAFALVAFLHFWYRHRLSEGRIPLLTLLGVCNLLALIVYWGFIQFVVVHP